MDVQLILELSLSKKVNEIIKASTKSVKATDS